MDLLDPGGVLITRSKTPKITVCLLFQSVCRPDGFAGSLSSMVEADGHVQEDAGAVWFHRGCDPPGFFFVNHDVIWLLSRARRAGRQAVQRHMTLFVC